MVRYNELFVCKFCQVYRAITFTVSSHFEVGRSDLEFVSSTRLETGLQFAHIWPGSRFTNFKTDRKEN